MKDAKNKKEKKFKRVILLPIIAVTTIIALGLIVFCLPINYNDCDSPCHSSNPKQRQRATSLAHTRWIPVLQSAP